MSLIAPARQTLLEMLPKQGIGAEVGVFKGDFSDELLQNAKPERLYLIDPWIAVEGEVYRTARYGTARRSQADMDQIHAGVMRRFSEQITSGRVVIHRAPSATVLAAMPDRSLDWIYIDGDHTYESVIADLRLAFVKVRPGGFICGDDYSADGWWSHAVIRAVHDFLHETQAQVRIKFVIDTQFMLLVVE